jgi:SAM-dependent methyltransferase|tara:strand:- start:854 stop:2791 length:1938 start_codon:yes stop_codon:yes gene_type:complete
VRCLECQRYYAVRDGAVDFLGLDGLFRAAELPKEEIRAIAHEVERDGLDEQLPSLIARHAELGAILAGARRVDWLFHCYDPDHASCCIDLGSGWGSLAFLLREFYRDVWSVEVAPERVAFQKARIHGEDVTNLHVIRADGLALPFASASADLVVLNGMLDGVVRSDSARSAEEIRIALLTEIRRVLKPAGVLYLGLRNRHAGWYRLAEWGRNRLWPGSSRSTHLPSPSAGQLAGPPVPVADGYGDSLALLQHAGFTSVSAYWTNDHRRPWVSGRLADMDGIAAFLRLYLRLRSAHPAAAAVDRVKIGIARIAASAPMRRCVGWAMARWPQSFLIFASATEFRPLEQRLFAGLGQPLFRMSGNDQAGKNLFFVQGAAERRVVKMVRFPDQRGALERAESMWASVNDRQVTQHHWSPLTGFVEPYVAGRPFQIFGKTDNHLALHWLLEFQQKRGQGSWPAEHWLRMLRKYEALASPLIAGAARRQIESACAAFAQTREAFVPQRVPEHGDLCAVNLFFEGAGRLHVMDWEHCVEAGDNLFDLCHFLTLNSIAEGKDAATSLQKNWSGSGRYSSVLSGVIRDWSERTATAPDVIVSYVPIMFARVIVRSRPRSRFWADHYLTFQKLLHAWAEASQQIRSHLTRPASIP